jgi:hypothetical protein
MFTLEKMCPITAIDSYYNAETKEFKLLIGDENGTVRVQDISGILKQIPNLKAEDVTKNSKRSPWRYLPIENAENELMTVNDAFSETSSTRGGEEGEVETLLGEDVFNQIAVISCHSDVIKSVQYISVTDQPLIFTAGMDRMAKIWNLQGECQGTLKQGYMRQTNCKTCYFMTLS